MNNHQSQLRLQKVRKLINLQAVSAACAKIKTHTRGQYSKWSEETKLVANATNCKWLQMHYVVANAKQAVRHVNVTIKRQERHVNLAVFAVDVTIFKEINQWKIHVACRKTVMTVTALLNQVKRTLKRKLFLIFCFLVALIYNAVLIVIIRNFVTNSSYKINQCSKGNTKFKKQCLTKIQWKISCPTLLVQEKSAQA